MFEPTTIHVEFATAKVTFDPTDPGRLKFAVVKVVELTPAAPGAPSVPGVPSGPGMFSVVLVGHGLQQVVGNIKPWLRGKPVLQFSKLAPHVKSN
jgi:hypothetical protein